MLSLQIAHAVDSGTCSFKASINPVQMQTPAGNVLCKEQCLAAIVCHYATELEQGRNGRNTGGLQLQSQRQSIYLIPVAPPCLQNIFTA